MRPIAFALLASTCALVACDELEVADDPDALAELRGNKSCVRAVNNQTGTTGATPNTTLAVVEVNQYVINSGDGDRWTCYTDDSNVAKTLVKLPPPPAPPAEG